MPIDTHIEGDAGQCRAAAQWLADVARAAHQAGTTLNSARQTSEGSWVGQAGDRYRQQAQTLVQDADDAGEKAQAGSTALTTFAGAVDAAKEAMTRARGIATAGGLTVAGEIIQDPVAAPAAPLVPAGQALSPAQEGSYQQAVTTAENQRAAYDQAKTVADDANSRYDQAQQELTDTLNPLGAVLQNVKTGLTWAGRVYGGPAGLQAAAKKWGDKATSLSERATLWRNLVNNPTISDKGWATAYAKQIDLETQAARARGVATSADRLLPGALRTGVGSDVLRAINANPGTLVTGTSTLARGSRAVLGKVPYLGAAVTTYGIGADLKSGKSTTDAVVGNVAPFVAGSLASTGTGAVLLAAGFAGGPVTLAAVGAGMLVSWGVGKAWEAWGDDITDAAGDAWDSVKDGVGSIF